MSPGTMLALCAAAALLLAFIAYGPALRGPFLFDDAYLPFATPDPPPQNLRAWLGVVRPLLMTTYWANFRLAGTEPFGYHVVNVFIHWVASLLVFFILRRLLERAGVEAGRRSWLAAIGGAVFLLHPVQTEAVAYIAGRSESLSVTLLLAAYAVFLYREGPISWTRAAAVLALFGAAVLSKEHVVALLPLMLLTDYWWDPGFSFTGIRRNWRVYLPVALGAAAGVAFLWELIMRSGTAGFGMTDLKWYHYLFTQFRALLVYVRLFVLPFGLTVDYDFNFSRTVLEHGAVFGLIVLVAVTAAAWRLRKRWPLACFGWFVFLVLMSPTSSVLPIKDAIAERRLYLGMLGLLLIAMGALSRLRLDRTRLAAILGAVCLAGLVLTHTRAGVWSDELAMWQDAVAKTPEKARPHFQLGAVWLRQGRCDLAASEFETTSRLQKPSYDLFVDWALALDCLNQPDAALAKLREAAALENTAHVNSQIGMVYAKQSRWPEALAALDRSLAIDPNYPAALIYRGGVLLSTGDAAGALAACEHALAASPGNPQAVQCRDNARQRLGSAAR